MTILDDLISKLPLMSPSVLITIGQGAVFHLVDGVRLLTFAREKEVS